MTHSLPTVHRQSCQSGAYLGAARSTVMRSMNTTLDANPLMRCARATCFAKASFPLAPTSAVTSPPFAHRVARLAAHLRPLHTHSQVRLSSPLSATAVRPPGRIVVRMWHALRPWTRDHSPAHLGPRR